MEKHKSVVRIFCNNSYAIFISEPDEKISYQKKEEISTGNLDQLKIVRIWKNSEKAKVSKHNEQWT